MSINYYDFPNELDLNYNILYDKNKNKFYDLIGIIEHYGSELVGYYVSKCLNFIDGNWYQFDDTFVSKIPKNNNINKTTNSNSTIIFILSKKRDNLNIFFNYLLYNKN